MMGSDIPFTERQLGSQLPQCQASPLGFVFSLSAVSLTNAQHPLPTARQLRGYQGPLPALPSQGCHPAQLLFPTRLARHCGSFSLLQQC